MSRLILSLMLLPVVTSTSANAAVDCSGTISKLFLGPDGDVRTEFGSVAMKLCSIDTVTAADRGANGGGPVSITARRCDALYSFF